VVALLPVDAVNCGATLKVEFGAVALLSVLALTVWHADEDYAHTEYVRCAFFDRNLHSRMPLDPTNVRLKRA
jgi:hypothetical protein